jgi:carbon monoxide dehydrogenase subunit G
MKLEQSFEVQAPIAAVWAALTDVERVAPCLPGAEITGLDEDGTYRGSFQVKLGPTTAAYRGSLRLEGLDEAGHVATMRAEGTDKRGQGGAKATMVSTLTEHEGATRVDVVTDFTITGRLARFGRGGMVQDVSNRLLRDFASCLQAHLADEPAALPAPVPDAPPADPRPAGRAGTSGDEVMRAVAVAGPEGADAAPGEMAGEGSTGEGSAALLAAAPAAAASPAASPPAAAPRAAGPARPRPAKPVNAFRLLLGVLGDRIRRLLKR